MDVLAACTASIGMLTVCLTVVRTLDSSAAPHDSSLGTDRLDGVYFSLSHNTSASGRMILICGSHIDHCSVCCLRGIAKAM